MNKLLQTSLSFDWWTDELADRRVALVADAHSPELQGRVTEAEEQLERAGQRYAAAMEREEDSDYAAQWGSWAFGPDVNPTS